MRQLLSLLGAAIIACISTGCTHTQLCYNHTRQAKTLTGIYEQQVLDNLAMFVGNSAALPFFAVPEAGASQVSDSGALAASPLNGPTHTLLSLTNLSRNNFGSWSFAAITDPQKLELMRCAYRRAIGASNPSTPCINCCTLQQTWAGKTGADTSVCCDCCPVRPLKLETCSKSLFHNPCDKIGSYCGTHIRVCPESYDALTQLVLTILDYAVNEPQLPPLAEVQHVHYKTDANGNIIFDPQGRPIIDYIDTFTALAHPFPARKEGYAAEIVPAPVPMVMPMRSPMSELLEEQIRQQRRSTLLPRF